MKMKNLYQDTSITNNMQEIEGKILDVKDII